MSTAQISPEVEQKRLDEAYAVLTDIAQRLSPEDTKLLGNALEIILVAASQKAQSEIKRFAAAATQLTEQAFQQIERKMESSRPCFWCRIWRR